jgi:hypothetical protein
VPFRCHDVVLEDIGTRCGNVVCRARVRRGASRVRSRGKMMSSWVRCGDIDVSFCPVERHGRGRSRVGVEQENRPQDAQFPSSCRAARISGDILHLRSYRLFESPSLRQDAQSGLSFSASRRRPEPRRMRAFPAICPNHGNPSIGPFRAAFCLSQPTFSDATEPRRFWYGCEKLDKSIRYEWLEQAWV